MVKNVRSIKAHILNLVTYITTTIQIHIYIHVNTMMKMLVPCKLTGAQYACQIHIFQPNNLYNSTLHITTIFLKLDSENEVATILFVSNWRDHCIHWKCIKFNIMLAVFEYISIFRLNLDDAIGFVILLINHHVLSELEFFQLQEPLKLDMVISFPDHGFHLRFDPWSQV